VARSKEVFGIVIKKTLFKPGNDRGIISIEFALLLPAFAAILFAIVEFGVTFHRQQIITSAAREAARFGVMSGDPRPNAAQIENVAITFIERSGLAIDAASVDINGVGGEAGDELSVTVGYPSSFKLLGGIIKAVGGSHGSNSGPGSANSGPGGGGNSGPGGGSSPIFDSQLVLHSTSVWRIE